MEFIVFITIIWFHCYHIRKQWNLLPVRPYYYWQFELAQSRDFRSNLYQSTLMKSVPEKWIKSGTFSLSYTEKVGSLIIHFIMIMSNSRKCMGVNVTNKLMIFFPRALYYGDTHIKAKVIFSFPSMHTNCLYKLFLEYHYWWARFKQWLIDKNTNWPGYFFWKLKTPTTISSLDSYL